MFRIFNVGDVVFSLRYGWGKVRATTLNGIEVKVYKMTEYLERTFDGRISSVYALPDLIALGDVEKIWPHKTKCRY